MSFVCNAIVTDGLVAESLEKLMENKLIKEKKMELEKKLDGHRRKFEKVSKFFNFFLIKNNLRKIMIIIIKFLNHFRTAYLY